MRMQSTTTYCSCFLVNRKWELFEQSLAQSPLDGIYNGTPGSEVFLVPPLLSPEPTRRKGSPMLTIPGPKLSHVPPRPQQRWSWSLWPSGCQSPAACSPGTRTPWPVAGALCGGHSAGRGGGGCWPWRESSPQPRPVLGSYWTWTVSGDWTLPGASEETSTDWE